MATAAVQSVPPAAAAKDVTGKPPPASQPAKDDGKKRVKKVKRPAKSAQDAKRDEQNEASRAAEKERELMNEFTPLMFDFSRQRLRTLLMSLRRSGDVEARISVKDLINVFQEHSLKLPSHVLQTVIELFENCSGIDYERLWRLMARAQASTGRDSALAMRRRNDLESTNRFQAEEDKDAELLRRIKEQMAAGKDDLQSLKKVFQIKDKNKTGKLTVDEILQIAQEKNLSVYGAVLKALLKRCSVANTNTVSWPEIVSFLEKGHPTAAKSDGDKAGQQGGAGGVGQDGAVAGPATLNPFTGRPLERPQTTAPMLKRGLKPQMSRQVSARSVKQTLRHDRPSTASSNRPLVADHNAISSSPGGAVSSAGGKPVGISSSNSSASLAADTPSASKDASTKISLSLNLDDLDGGGGGGGGKAGPQRGSSTRGRPGRPPVTTRGRPQSAAVVGSIRPQRAGSAPPSSRRVHSARPRTMTTSSSVPGSMAGAASNPTGAGAGAGGGAGAGAGAPMGSRRRVASAVSSSRISLRSSTDDGKAGVINGSNSSSGNNGGGQQQQQQVTSVLGMRTSQSAGNLQTFGGSNTQGGAGALAAGNDANGTSGGVANSANGIAGQTGPSPTAPPSDGQPSVNASAKGKQQKHVTLVEEPKVSQEETSKDKKQLLSRKKKDSAENVADAAKEKDATPATGILKHGPSANAASRYKTSTFATKNILTSGSDETASNKNGSASATNGQPSSGPAVAVPPEPSKKEVMIKGKKHFFSSLPSSNPDLPREKPGLQWIYGYRGNDCRNNIFVLMSGEIAYFIGNYVVLYDRASNVQRHYKEHTNDVKCMTVHQNGVTVASGQGDDRFDPSIKVHIRLWRADTLQTLHILGENLLKSSVSCLAFTCLQEDIPEEKQTAIFNEQDRLVAVDEAPEKVNMFVWDSFSGKPLASAVVPVSLICDVAFCPRDPTIIAVAGKEHLGWWKMDVAKGSIDLILTPDYQDYLRAMYVHCLFYLRTGELVTGDSNGTVYVWPFEGTQICNIIKHAHEEPIFAMLFHRGHLITAGRDGYVRGWLWGKNMDKTGDIQIPYMEGGVRMIQIHRDQLYIGTTTNSILTATLAGPALRNPLSGITLNSIAVTEGHYGVVTALCRPPDPNFQHLIMSFGKDGVVCLFDTDRRVPMWKYRLRKTKILCADLVKENIMVVGTQDSVCMFEMVVTEESGMDIELIFSIALQSPSGSVTAVRATPDGETVVAGDALGIIHVFGIVELDTGEQQWDLVGRLEGHTGTVTSLDWSRDLHEESLILRSSSNIPEVMYWNNNSLTRVTDEDSVSGMQWLTNTCWLGADISGVWLSKRAQEAEITTINVNSANGLVAVGDNQGQVSVYRYPCTSSFAFAHQFKAHSSVSQVYFTGDGRYLLTVGGADQAIMQWLLN